jgi:hypothetical protein
MPGRFFTAKYKRHTEWRETAPWLTAPDRIAERIAASIADWMVAGRVGSFTASAMPIMATTATATSGAARGC